MAGGGRIEDPLVNLREYRRLAPWSLRDLANLTAAILDSAGVRPINAAAAAHPTERTIRFYVTRSLVTAPEGRGTAATYSYRHLLQVLAIKLRQMEGATLTRIAEELTATTGDVLERRVASALGPGLPPPTVLPLSVGEAQPRGRSGQILRVWPAAPTTSPDEAHVATWRRLPVSDGVELHLRQDHPLAGQDDVELQLAEAVRLAVGRMMSPLRSMPGSSRGAGGASERTGHHS